MTNPTPMLRPSPMDISGLFAGTFEALKRRLGLFILLALFPSILILAVLLIAALVGGGGALTGNNTATTGAIIAAGLILVVGIIAAVLAQYKSYGMMSLAAYKIAQNQTPDFRGLWARSKGFLPRMMPLILIGLAATLVLYLLFFGAIIGLLMSISGSTNSGASAAIGGVFALLALMFFVGVPLAVFLAVKLLYTVPAVAIEQRSGIDAWKRSWRLTKGQFWRTFGYAILAQLAVLAILWVISLVSQVFTGVVSASLPSTDNPAQVMAALLTVVPALLLSVGLQLAVQLFTTPFLQTYQTYMFVDQVRRNELPPQQYGFGATGYGFPGAQPGQAFPPQGSQQYPGQTPQQYPAQPPYLGQPPPGQYPQQPQPYPGQQPPESGRPQNQWPRQS